MATCMKHFPGDGTEENDQHLIMGVNEMSCEEWDQTYGKVYKALIDEGVMTVMAGHIALPAYSRKLRPGIKDEMCIRDRVCDRPVVCAEAPGNIRTIPQVLFLDFASIYRRESFKFIDADPGRRQLF